MMAPGLLWFDDDARRPVAAKIAEALQRYRERVGFEPTLCQVNPAQTPPIVAAGSAAPRRRTAQAEPLATLPATLAIVATDQMPQHHFLVGVAPGETPTRLPGWGEDGEPAAAPDRPARHTSAAPRRRVATRPRVAAAAASSPAPAISAPVLASAAPGEPAIPARAPRAAKTAASTRTPGTPEMVRATRATASPKIASAAPARKARVAVPAVGAKPTAPAPRRRRTASASAAPATAAPIVAAPAPVVSATPVPQRKRTPAKHTQQVVAQPSLFAEPEAQPQGTRKVARGRKTHVASALPVAALPPAPTPAPTLASPRRRRSA